MKTVARSYSRGRDETFRTGPNAPLEPVQSDFACSASNETKKLEMDEFRRLKVMTLLPPESFNDWGGGQGCHKFVPVLGGNGTKKVPPGDLSDQPSSEMS